MVSFYAAAIGVMFLLFTRAAPPFATGRVENGTLDRVLSSRVTMTALLAGKLAYSALLAFSQLVVMFLWAWAVFKLDLFSHIPGFVVMGVSTALRWALLACCWPACAGRARNWRTLDIGDSGNVLRGRQHVSTLPHARGDAESGIVDDQCVGHRWIHESVLARSAGLGSLAPSVGASYGWRCAVRDCPQARATLGLYVTQLFCSR